MSPANPSYRLIFRKSWLPLDLADGRVEWEAVIRSSRPNNANAPIAVVRPGASAPGHSPATLRR